MNERSSPNNNNCDGAPMIVNRSSVLYCTLFPTAVRSCYFFFVFWGGALGPRPPAPDQASAVGSSSGAGGDRRVTG